MLRVSVVENMFYMFHATDILSLTIYVREGYKLHTLVYGPPSSSVMLPKSHTHPKIILRKVISTFR